MAAGMSAQQIPQHHKRLRPRKISSISTSRNLRVRVGKETLQPLHTRPGVRYSQHRGTGPHFPSGPPWRKRGSLCAHELGRESPPGTSGGRASALLSVVPSVKPCFPSNVFLGPQCTLHPMLPRMMSSLGVQAHAGWHPGGIPHPHRGWAHPSCDHMVQHRRAAPTAWGL